MHSENADFIRGESVVTFMINFSWDATSFFTDMTQIWYFFHEDPISSFYIANRKTDWLKNKRRTKRNFFGVLLKFEW